MAYHNASVKYAFSKAMTLSFGVDNLLDKAPPYIQSWTDGNTDTMTYDLLGRRWHARVGLSFLSHQLYREPAGPAESIAAYGAGLSRERRLHTESTCNYLSGYAAPTNGSDWSSASRPCSG